MTAPGQVQFINAGPPGESAGPSVRVTLFIEGTGEFVEAELTRDVFQNLGLQQSEEVFIRPRQVRVFVEDYQI